MSLVYGAGYSETNNPLTAPDRKVYILANNIEAAIAAANIVVSRRVNRRDYILYGIHLICEIDIDATQET